MTKNIITITILISFFTAVLTGVLFGLLTEQRILSKYGTVPEKIIQQQIIKPGETKFIPQTTEEQKVIEVVKKASPAVVSIIVTKDLPVIEEYNPFEEFFNEPFLSPFEFRVPQYRQKGTEKKEIGGGTGFIISSDGLILTNKHVVEDENAEYTVLTNDGNKFPAQVLARDPVQDLAIIKINKDRLPTLSLGNSDNIQIGQSVITIGNALGEFRNTVSVGVVSGLRRTITASGSLGGNETLEEVIQTDAAINRGNSGGPLLNLSGEVIGVNTAIALGAENIGFAIPINKAKKDINDVKTKGRIVYPFLGVRYIIITKDFAEKNNLSVDYGVLVHQGEDQTALAVTPGSAADQAGIQENDIILEFGGVKINQNNSLAKLISQKNVGDTVTLKILHQGKEMVVQIILGERK